MQRSFISFEWDLHTQFFLPTVAQAEKSIFSHRYAPRCRWVEGEKIDAPTMTVSKLNNFGSHKSKLIMVVLKIMPGKGVGSHCRIKVASAQPSRRPSPGGRQQRRNEKCHLLKTIRRGPPPRFDLSFTGLDIISKAWTFLRLRDLSAPLTTCLTPEGCATRQLIITGASCSIFIRRGLSFYFCFFRPCPFSCYRPNKGRR